VQPAVGDPASAGGLDWVTHRGPFQPLLFCDSVILWFWPAPLPGPQEGHLAERRWEQQPRG